MRLRATSARVTGHGQPSLIQRAIRILTDGTQGWWYDPSDFSTLFQDAAGTTPVTAVEQPVGLMLDKSFGLVLGTEKWPTTFSIQDANWSIVGGGVYSSNGGTGNLFNAGVLTVGKTYKYTITVLTRTSGSLFAPYDGTGATQRSISAVGVYTGYFTATTALLGVYSTAFNGTIGSISVRELPGNHATQATSTSRPILRNRYNLLLNSEFTGAVAGSPGLPPTGWVNATTTGQIASVVGGLTVSTSNSRRSFRQSMSVVVGQQVVATLRAIVNSGVVSLNGLVAHIGVLASAQQYYLGDIPVAYSTVAPVGAPIDIKVLLTIGTAGSFIMDFGFGVSGNASGDVTLLQASLVNASDAHLPYQRVNTPTDYDSDTSKFPLYLDPDGSDDGMVTAAFAAGSDKVTVFAAVHKRSDAAAGMLLEFSSDISSNPGTFALYAPSNGGQGNFYVRARGSSVSTANASGAVSTPGTYVVAFVNHISGDSLRLLINGAQVAQSTTDQGTGNFGTYPLYLFRRAGTSLPFNGRFYGGAGKFRTLSDSEIATVEQYLRMKSKAY